MAPFFRINVLGIYAEKYLILVLESQIPDISDNYIVVDLKTNLQNLQTTANSTESLDMRKALAEVRRAQLDRVVALYKLVDAALFSADPATKSAAAKIGTVLKVKLSDMKAMREGERDYYYRTVLGLLALEEYKAAIATLKIQPNIDLVAKCVADYDAEYKRFVDFKGLSKESSRAGYHKSRIEANIRDFDSLVAVKVKEPKADLWVELQMKLAQNKEYFTQRQKAIKANADAPVEVNPVADDKADVKSV